MRGGLQARHQLNRHRTTVTAGGADEAKNDLGLSFRLSIISKVRLHVGPVRVNDPPPFRCFLVHLSGVPLHGTFAPPAEELKREHCYITRLLHAGIDDLARFDLDRASELLVQLFQLRTVTQRPLLKGVDVGNIRGDQTQSTVRISVSPAVEGRPFERENCACSRFHVEIVTVT